MSVLRAHRACSSSLTCCCCTLLQAYTLFNAGPTTVPVNLQPLVFASVVRWAAPGDSTYYDALVALYEVGCQEWVDSCSVHEV